MQSNRILLSDKHAHSLLLTEQEIGIIDHGLRVLWEAFSEEPQYAKKVFNLRAKLTVELQQGTVEEL